MPNKRRNAKSSALVLSLCGGDQVCFFFICSLFPARGPAAGVQALGCCRALSTSPQRPASPLLGPGAGSAEHTSGQARAAGSSHLRSPRGAHVWLPDYLPLPPELRSPEVRHGTQVNASFVPVGRTDHPQTHTGTCTHGSPRASSSHRRQFPTGTNLVPAELGGRTFPPATAWPRMDVVWKCLSLVPHATRVGRHVLRVQQGYGSTCHFEGRGA